MKKLIFSVCFLVLSASAFAANSSALSVPGYFGSINNNSSFVIECSQVVGGYCANNPMPANGYIQMLPDPGSSIIRGHLMVFQKNVPGKYLDNISFTYQQQKDGSWKFSTTSMYHQLDIKSILPDTIVLNGKG